MSEFSDRKFYGYSLQNDPMLLTTTRNFEFRYTRPEVLERAIQKVNKNETHGHGQKPVPKKVRIRKHHITGAVKSHDRDLETQVSVCHEGAASNVRAMSPQEIDNLIGKTRYSAEDSSSCSPQHRSTDKLGRLAKQHETYIVEEYREPQPQWVEIEERPNIDVATMAEVVKPQATVPRRYSAHFGEDRPEQGPRVYFAEDSDLEYEMDHRSQYTKFIEQKPKVFDITVNSQDSGGFPEFFEVEKCIPRIPHMDLSFLKNSAPLRYTDLTDEVHEEISRHEIPEPKVYIKNRNNQDFASAETASNTTTTITANDNNKKHPSKETKAAQSSKIKSKSQKSSANPNNVIKQPKPKACLATTTATTTKQCNENHSQCRQRHATNSPPNCARSCGKHNNSTNNSPRYALRDSNIRSTKYFAVAGDVTTPRSRLTGGSDSLRGRRAPKTLEEVKNEKVVIFSKMHSTQERIIEVLDKLRSTPTPTVMATATSSSSPVREKHCRSSPRSALNNSRACSRTTSGALDEVEARHDDTSNGDVTLRSTSRMNSGSTSSRSRSRRKHQNAPKSLDDLKLEKVEIFSKMHSTQERIIELLDKLRLNLLEIYIPENSYEKNKRQKNAFEFTVRFSRNFLYPLKGMVDDLRITQAEQFNSSSSNDACHRVSSIYSLILQSLQTYQKQLRYFLLDQVPQKLSALLEHIATTTNLCLEKQIFDKNDAIIDCLRDRCSKFLGFLDDLHEERYQTSRDNCKKSNQNENMQAHYELKMFMNDLNMYEPKLVPRKDMHLGKRRTAGGSNKTIKKDRKIHEFEPSSEMIYNKNADDKIDTHIQSIDNSLMDQNTRSSSTFALHRAQSGANEPSEDLQTVNTSLNKVLMEALHSVTKEQVRQVLEPILQTLGTALDKKKKTEVVDEILKAFNISINKKLDGPSMQRKKQRNKCSSKSSLGNEYYADDDIERRHAANDAEAECADEEDDVQQSHSYSIGDENSQVTVSTNNEYDDDDGDNVDDNNNNGEDKTQAHSVPSTTKAMKASNSTEALLRQRKTHQAANCSRQQSEQEEEDNDDDDSNNDDNDDEDDDDDEEKKADDDVVCSHKNNNNNNAKNNNLYQHQKQKQNTQQLQQQYQQQQQQQAAQPPHQHHNNINQTNEAFSVAESSEETSEEAEEEQESNDNDSNDGGEGVYKYVNIDNLPTYNHQNSLRVSQGHTATIQKYLQQQYSSFETLKSMTSVKALKSNNASSKSSTAKNKIISALPYSQQYSRHPQISKSDTSRRRNKVNLFKKRRNPLLPPPPVPTGTPSLSARSRLEADINMVIQNTPHATSPRPNKASTTSSRSQKSILNLPKYENVPLTHGIIASEGDVQYSTRKPSTANVSKSVAQMIKNNNNLTGILVQCLEDFNDMTLNKGGNATKESISLLQPMELDVSSSPYKAPVKKSQRKVHEQQLRKQQDEERQRLQRQQQIRQQLVLDPKTLRENFSHLTSNNNNRSSDDGSGDHENRNDRLQLDNNNRQTRAQTHNNSNSSLGFDQGRPQIMNINELIQERDKFVKMCNKNRFYDNPNYKEPWKVFSRISNNIADEIVHTVEQDFNAGVSKFVEDFLQMETKS